MALILITFLTLTLTIGSVILMRSGFGNTQENNETPRTIQLAVEQKPKEQDQQLGIYNPPKISPKQEYTIFLLGDSMTNALGPHGGIFYEYINKVYKPKGVVVDNYGYSANIFSIDDRLNQPTTVWDVNFDPIINRQFDVIIIESFAYNPLSQFPIEKGLMVQNQFLEATVKNLMNAFPNSQIIFLVTISPNKATYARRASGISSEQSRNQAEERIAYIKNHIEFAKTHHIPLINVYEKSQTADGDGNLVYINPDDNIHPSTAGLELIATEITKFIGDNQILPK